MVGGRPGKSFAPVLGHDIIDPINVDGVEHGVFAGDRQISRVGGELLPTLLG